MKLISSKIQDKDIEITLSIPIKEASWLVHPKSNEFTLKENLQNDIIIKFIDVIKTYID